MLDGPTLRLGQIHESFGVTRTNADCTRLRIVRDARGNRERATVRCAAPARARRGESVRPNSFFEAVGRRNASTVSDALSKRGLPERQRTYQADGHEGIRPDAGVIDNPAGMRMCRDRTSAHYVVLRRVHERSQAGRNGCCHRSPGNRPKRTSSSSTSMARGRSRSIPGLGPLPPTVISRNGFGGAVGIRRLSASSSVPAMNALTLTPRAAASRRTCAASRSSSEIVVRMHAEHNRTTSLHQPHAKGLIQLFAQLQRLPHVRKVQPTARRRRRSR